MLLVFKKLLDSCSHWIFLSKDGHWSFPSLASGNGGFRPVHARLWQGQLRPILQGLLQVVLPDVPENEVTRAPYVIWIVWWQSFTKQLVSKWNISVGIEANVVQCFISFSPTGGDRWRKKILNCNKRLTQASDVIRSFLTTPYHHFLPLDERDTA